MKSPYGLLFLMCFLLCLPAVCAADIIITEIMYNPEGAESANEYVELYNNGDYKMPLNGYTISDGSGTDQLYEYLGDGSGFYLYPEQYALIIDPDYWVEDEPIYGELVDGNILLLTIEDTAIGSGGLSNSTAETITLRNPSNLIESQRTYLLGAENGQSEERIDLFGGDENENWNFSEPGGSPGATNTIALVEEDFGISHIMVEPGDDVSMERPLRLRATIFNNGRETDERRFYLYVHRYSGDVHLGIVGSSEEYTPVLSTGGTYDFVYQVDAVAGGRYEFGISISGNDDRIENNTAEVDTLLAFHPGALRITEVMTDPPDTYHSEWIEITSFDTLMESNLPRMVNLGGWSLRDAQGVTLLIDDESEWNVSLDSPANPRFLLTQNEELLSWPSVDGDQVGIGQPWPSLNNSGDSLTLMDPTGAVIDRVVFGEAEGGKSLVRLALDRDATIEDWRISTDVEGGTPGRHEDIQLTGQDYAIVALDTLSQLAETYGPPGYIRVYTVNAYIENAGNGTPPDSITVQLTYQQYGEETLETNTRSIRISAPSPANVEIAQFYHITSIPGLLHTQARLLVEDDDPVNDSLSVDVLLAHERNYAMINEAMTRPGNNNGGEWIELKVNTDFKLSFADWVLEDQSGHRTRPVPIAGPLRTYSDYVILAEDSAAFVQAWPDIDRSIVIPCETWAKLNDLGDTITLFDPTGNVIRTETFPVCEFAGNSLEKTYSSTWYMSNDSTGATPGRDNSPYQGSNPDYPDEIHVSVSPNPFSPDGDGFEDGVRFTFQLPASYMEVSIRLFDTRGNQVATILDNATVYTGQTITWDGKVGLTIPKLRVGMYVYIIEVDGNNKGKNLKGVLVSAGTQ